MRSHFVLACLLGFSVFPTYADELISRREAALPNAPLASLEGIQLRGISRAPGVKLLSPVLENGAVNSPMHFQVGFEPHGGAKIVLSSVKLTYLKKPLVDLTERARKGITAEGIDMPTAEVPPGEHHLRVSVTDSNGRTTSQIVTLNVVK